MTDTNRHGDLLGATAYWTAAVRGMEDARTDSLFDDPWANALAGQTGREWIEQRTEASVVPIVLRIRYYDDYLQRIVRSLDIRQIVVMAAGLDTRAYRLSWPDNTRFFELEQPQVLAYKERILSEVGATATCERIPIGVDLVTPWETMLEDAGYDRDQPSAWLLEGFLFYLETDVLMNLLDRALAMTAPGSAIGFDIVNSETLTSHLTNGWVDMQAQAGAPWLGSMDDPVGYLSERGWDVTLSTPGAPEANHGRWQLPVIPAAMPNMPHLWYITAEKKK